MVLPDVADMEKSLAARGQGPHPGVVPPKMINDTLDFMIRVDAP